MSKLGDALRVIGIINTHDLLRAFGAKGRDVSVSYNPYQRHHLGGATVYSPSHKTDPGAHFMDMGKKRFMGNRTESMRNAIAWASEKYGITDWANDPTFRGGKVPTDVVERAKKAVAEGKK